jgi:hypothetical protein
MGGWVDGPREDKTAVHALPAEGGAAVHCARPTMERESVMREILLSRLSFGLLTG